MTEGKKRTILLGIFFAVYTFEYMVTLTLIDKGITLLADAEHALLLHYADTALVGTGFLSFALLRKLFRTEKARRFLLYVPDAVYILGIVCIYFMETPVFYSGAAMLTSLFLGVRGGMVYFCMSLALVDSPHVGRCMGLGASAAVLLQYLLQEFLDLSVGLPLILAVGFGFTGWLVYQNPWDWLTLDSLPYAEDSKERNYTMGKALLILCLTVIFLEIIISFYDEQLVRSSILSGYGEITPYSWPRLFVAVGYLTMGFLSDLRKQKYVPLAALCAGLVAILTPILLGSPQYYMINMCIFYLVLGCEVLYLTLMFWNIAPKTKLPELWAGVGRVIICFCNCIFPFFHRENLSLPVLIGVDILMLILLIIGMAIGGYLSFEKEETAWQVSASQGEVLSGGELMRLYAEDHNLTPRERDVLEKLLETEDDLQEIADTLAISRRVLQRYTASIYGKTETKNRLGLYKDFRNFVP